MGEIADAIRQANREDSADGHAAGLGPTARHRRTPDAEDGLPEPAPETLLRKADVLEPPPLPAPAPAPPREEARPLVRERRVISLPAESALAEPHTPAELHFRRIAFRVREHADSGNMRSIVITSAQPGEGKTTIACNLALQLARLDSQARVVLVDMDLHRARIARALGVEVETGLESVLRGEQGIEETVLETDVPGFFLFALAEPVANAERLLASPRLQAMIGDLESQFDYVIIDTPPVLASSDAQVILRHASTALFITRAGLSPVKAVRHAIQQIPAKKILGSLLNGTRLSRETVDYAYYSEADTASKDEPSTRALDPTDGK